jgi:hypothetical protein
VLLAIGAVLTLFILYRNESLRPFAKSAWPLAFLLVPIPFYALSVAYGGVPIFVPEWWPFTHYNVRYGLQLLPAFCASLALLVSFTLRLKWNWRLRFASVLVLLAFVLASYSRVWRAGPVCLQEAEINMKTRNQLEIQLSTWLERLPPDATLLMYLGDHVGAVERAGIPLRNTINEGKHRVWKQPTGPGLWSALADLRSTDYVLAFEGDPVGRPCTIFRCGTGRIHVTGQARAVLYHSVTRGAAA